MEPEEKRKYGGRSCSGSIDNHNEHTTEPVGLRVFFVHVGLDLPLHRITLLSARAQEKGALAITHFRAPPTKKKRKKLAWWNKSDQGDGQQQQQQQQEEVDRIAAMLPTHLVIGEDCSAQQVTDKLHFSSVDQFERFMRANHIKCAIPRWITHAEGQLESELKLNERWWKVDTGSKRRAASNEQDNEKENAASQSQLGQDPEDDDDDDDDRPNNDALADALKELGKLHQKCPINDDDTWKAYALDKIAGRIRHLDFQVTLEREAQERLKSIHGIGTSTMEKVNQFLQTGEIRRTQEFRKDPDRMAMKAMMGIWGVGRKTATSLIKRGYKTIDDVRNALEEDKIQLDRNQCIGVQCYEDFLEQMTREEVECIGKILEDAILSEFPGDKKRLEVTIMGSYRRGSESCGDVDVLITHQDHVEEVPPQVLGEVVEKLLEVGNMAYHLTLISGMKVRRQDDFHEGGFNDLVVGSPSKQKSDKYSGSSYMGVFNSPTVPGKRRRVDIKFYPYRARAFCWLYFTGNGFFNRSMRLWATRQHGLLLNDQGLYERGGKNPVLEASDEKEVFCFLGLQYKEPHERDCFNAVVGDDDPDKFSISERNEERDHQWIESVCRPFYRQKPCYSI